MKEISYDDLKKITRPVLLWIRKKRDFSLESWKLRILYPSGHCEFSWANGSDMHGFHTSCFVKGILNNTVEYMHSWDGDNKIIYLLGEL